MNSVSYLDISRLIRHIADFIDETNSLIKRSNNIAVNLATAKIVAEWAKNTPEKDVAAILFAYAEFLNPDNKDIKLTEIKQQEKDYF